MIKQVIKQRLDDAIADIFTDLQKDFQLEPETEDVGEGCRRAYFVDQITDSIVTETFFNLKQSFAKGENA
jgi:hypothetical protein